VEGVVAAEAAEEVVEVVEGPEVVVAAEAAAPVAGAAEDEVSVEVADAVVEAAGAAATPVNREDHKARSAHPKKRKWPRFSPDSNQTTWPRNSLAP
jgi:hypothetical protein